MNAANSVMSRSAACAFAVVSSCLAASSAFAADPVNVLASIPLSAVQVPSQSPQMCAALKDHLDKANADAQKIVDEAMKRAQDQTQGDKNDVNACAQGYITWERQHVALNVPEFTMKDQELSLDLPQVTMVQQHVIFDTPSIRCDDMQTGEYPEFYCDTHYLIPKCTTRWSPIITKVCKPFMQRQDIVMGIPEFKVARTSFKMGVPEVAMRRQDWYFDLPKFHVTSGCVGSQCKEKCEAAANKYQQDYQGAISEPIARAKQETSTAAAQYTQCNIGVLTSQRDAALAQIDAQIAIVQASLKSLISMGAADAAKQVQASLRQLIDERKKVADQFDQLIHGMNSTEVKSAAM